MADVDASLVKDLRVKTGAGFMDCKRALEQSKGNFEKAIEFLRKKGLSDAAKRSERSTNQGLVNAYIHAGGKIGVLVEVNCETDFVARNEKFQELVKNIAMQVAASNPLYLDQESIPSEVLEKEKEIFRDQAKEGGKPANVLDKIVEGKVKKYCSEVCLLEQPFVKDPDRKVNDILKEAISVIGENIKVRRFVRFALGG
ncbi:MAG TPA: translation elongation factor Ts [Bdellovibrionota bacterium]|nr:translation elongation factor Ts [Bdellovibrionota bacterium]